LAWEKVAAGGLCGNHWHRQALTQAAYGQVHLRDGDIPSGMLQPGSTIYQHTNIKPQREAQVPSREGIVALETIAAGECWIATSVQ